MKLFYFESHMGCGIRKARDIEAAERSVLREVGEANYQLVREATDSDIAWVLGMGGAVPDISRAQG